MSEALGHVGGSDLAERVTPNSPVAAASRVQPFRLIAGGQIERRPLAFSFDGREYQGFVGDTLASALLANGVRLVGPFVQVSPPSRHPVRRPRGAERAGRAEGRGAPRAQHPGHHGGTL